MASSGRCRASTCSCPSRSSRQTLLRGRQQGRLSALQLLNVPFRCRMLLFNNIVCDCPSALIPPAVPPVLKTSPFVHLTCI